MIKIACDVHGVISKHPKMFAEFSRFLLENGAEFHILTGTQYNQKLLDELKAYDVVWTKLFSVSSYLIEQGEHVRWDDPDNPWFDEVVWNSAKAKYCEREGILFHMDDSKEYEDYFLSTKYLRVV